MKWNILLVLGILFLISCEDEGIESLPEDPSLLSQEYINANVTTLTLEEELELANNGISQKLSRDAWCAWSDGIGGRLSCNGGECRVTRFTSNRSGKRYLALSCFDRGGDKPRNTSCYRLEKLDKD